MSPCRSCCSASMRRSSSAPRSIRDAVRCTSEHVAKGDGLAHLPRQQADRQKKRPRHRTQERPVDHCRTPPAAPAPTRIWSITFAAALPRPMLEAVSICPATCVLGGSLLARRYWVDQAHRRRIDGHRVPAGQDREILPREIWVRKRAARELHRQPVHNRQHDFVAHRGITVDFRNVGISIAGFLDEAAPIIHVPQRHVRQRAVEPAHEAVAHRGQVDDLRHPLAQHRGIVARAAELHAAREQILHPGALPIAELAISPDEPTEHRRP